MIRDNTVLITGVAGFIGSNLAEKLLNKGFSVIGVDNFSHGNSLNMKGFDCHKRFEFHKIDIREMKKLETIIGNRKLSCIVHLAAYKIPRYGNALETLSVNASGTENILELSRKLKAKLIFASTSEVYGKNPKLPFSEKSDLMVGPTYVTRWAYAVSKIYGEHLCLAYKAEFGIDLVILRFYGGYGPRQSLSWWGGAIPVFIGNALKNEPMPIHGDGKQTRTFTYVDDITDAVCLAISKKDVDGEVFNIGSNENISIIHVAETIWKMIRSNNPKIKMVPYEKLPNNYEDVMKRYPDNEKAKKILGFEVKKDLAAGLKETIEWQRGLE